jgi:hypothetical protein
MGTRNLTVVIHKDEIKMAQYGQWDGYPTGLGRDIAKVLKKHKTKKLCKAIDKCSFISEEEVLKRWEEVGADKKSGWVTMEVSDAFKEKYPNLSRDFSGGKALENIVKGVGLELANQLNFAADSLFCEWAYVINLDKEEVEVYKGFNQKPLKKKDRFFSVQTIDKKASRDERYFPVKLAKTYKFKGFTEKAMIALEKKINKADE